MAEKAYWFFADEQSNNVREQDPEAVFSMRQFRDMWEALSDEQRVPYEVLAAQDKKRYEGEVAIQKLEKFKKESY